MISGADTNKNIANVITIYQTFANGQKKSYLCMSKGSTLVFPFFSFQSTNSPPP